MKIVPFILLFLFGISLSGQEKALEMSKPGSEKTRVFKENKRIKLKTLNGEKYIGRFQILNANAIEIEGNIIYLSSISNIKSRTAMAGIASTAIIVVGAAVFVLGYAIMAVSNTSGQTGHIILGAISAAIVATGIFFNELARNYRHKNGWNYEIIEQ